MAVLNNKEKTECIVTCKCGCSEGIYFVVDKDDTDMYAIAILVGNGFYSETGILRSIKKKLQKIWEIICEKDRYLSEIIMTKEEFTEFKRFLNRF